VTLHVRRAGPRDPARGQIVFVHGFPFDGSMWEPQLAALPPGWRGIAPDLRGFGNSALAAGGALPAGSQVGGGVALAGEPVLTMDGLADDVALLMDREGTGPAVVCGLSMGGYVALSLWRRHPGLVRALVLADTRAEADSDEGKANRVRMAQAARDGGAAAVARTLMPALLRPATLGGERGAAERVRSMILATSPETIVAALAGMAVRADSVADLPAMDVPALVVVGEEDELTPPDVARSLAERLPRGRLVVVPEAGHVSSLENPDAFNAALSAFLADL
jgi:3-oxoadipate enol-lactonase